LVAEVAGENPVCPLVDSPRKSTLRTEVINIALTKLFAISTDVKEGLA
jgi:hypothetical protein